MATASALPRQSAYGLPAHRVWHGGPVGLIHRGILARRRGGGSFRGRSELRGRSGGLGSTRITAKPGSSTIFSKSGLVTVTLVSPATPVPGGAAPHHVTENHCSFGQMLLTFPGYGAG